MASPQDEPRQKVSDLMDGRLAPEEVPLALGELADPELRETWHVYHLIGDVLRSQDLAACRGGAAFVERLCAQLPQARQEGPLEDVAAAGARGAQAANDAVVRWKLVAGLACLAAVALWGWNLWGSAGGPASAPVQLAEVRASAPAAVPASAPQALAAMPVEQTELLADDQAAPVMLRDARLDVLLAAHRQSSSVSALGNAPGFLRNATYEGAGR